MSSFAMSCENSIFSVSSYPGACSAFNLAFSRMNQAMPAEGVTSFHATYTLFSQHNPQSSTRFSSAAQHGHSSGFPKFQVCVSDRRKMNPETNTDPSRKTPQPESDLSAVLHNLRHDNAVVLVSPTIVQLVCQSKWMYLSLHVGIATCARKLQEAPQVLEACSFGDNAPLIDCARPPRSWDYTRVRRNWLH